MWQRNIQANETEGVDIEGLNFELDRFQIPSIFGSLTRVDFFMLNEGGRGKHRKYLPYARTEHGVAMLSSVLRSPQAVQVNIEIIRAFVKLRAMTADRKALARRLNKLEEKYDKKFAVVFDAIREMMAPPQDKKQSIGFVHGKGN